MTQPHSCAEAINRLVSVAIVAIFSVITLPPILLGLDGKGGLASDAISYHLPQINYFLTHTGDLVKYPATATTLPFYHYLIAKIGGILGYTTIGNDSLGVRLGHWLLTVIGIALFTRRLPQLCGPINGFILAVPLVTSWHVLSGAIYYGTDGPMVTVLALTLVGGAAISTQAVIMVLAIMVRHLVFPFVFFYHLAQPLADRSLSGIVRLCLATLPALALLAFYMAQWGGLTPPGEVARLNPKGIFSYALLAHLGVAGLWGAAFGMLRLNAWLALLRDNRVRWIIAALAVVLTLVWLAVPTNPSLLDGRFGSVVWQLAGIGLVGTRSLCVLALSWLGAACLVLMFEDASRAGRIPAEVVGLIGFLVGLMLTYAAYQRYSEPPILMAMTLSTAYLMGSVRLPFWRYVPLAALSLTGILVILTRFFAH